MWSHHQGNVFGERVLKMVKNLPGKDDYRSRLELVEVSEESFVGNGCILCANIERRALQRRTQKEVVVGDVVRHSSKVSVARSEIVNHAKRVPKVGMGGKVFRSR